MSHKIMKVDAIKNGTVIDHLPPGAAMRVIRILNISQNSNLLIAMNVDSNKLNKKDIIKIEDRELSQIESNQIALLAPKAVISIIRDFKVAEKKTISWPKKIKNMVKCPNPACVTQLTEISTRFDKLDDQRLLCCYCEKPYTIDEVEIQ